MTLVFLTDEASRWKADAVFSLLPCAFLIMLTYRDVEAVINIKLTSQQSTRYLIRRKHTLHKLMFVVLRSVSHFVFFLARQ
jgi:hypothetical protein